MTFQAINGVTMMVSFHLGCDAL